MSGRQRDEDEVRAYVEAQAAERVIHVEHASSEMVGHVRHDIWDVHTDAHRWWVVSGPTNLYDQADFKSRDVVLTFHVGLAVRMAHLNEQRIPVQQEPAALLPGLGDVGSMRFAHNVRRCGECGSYDVRAGRCTHCDWVDETYEPPQILPLSDEEKTRRMAEPCIPSSDLSTFVRPRDVS